MKEKSVTFSETKTYPYKNNDRLSLIEKPLIEVLLLRV